MNENLCQGYLEFLLLETGEPQHLKFYKIACHTSYAAKGTCVLMERVLHPCVLPSLYLQALAFTLTLWDWS